MKFTDVYHAYQNFIIIFFAFFNQSVYNARHIFTMRVISLTNYIWIYMSLPAGAVVGRPALP